MAFSARIRRDGAVAQAQLRRLPRSPGPDEFLQARHEMLHVEGVAWHSFMMAWQRRAPERGDGESGC